MFKALKSLFEGTGHDTALPGFERRRLQLAVASLLHESTRVDFESHAAEFAAAERALAALFGLERPDCAALLDETQGNGSHTSYFSQVSVIKRDFSMPQRVLLIEHLWRIAYAHGTLHQYEDHFVRKIAHLLYVPNTQCMLARSRAQNGK